MMERCDFRRLQGLAQLQPAGGGGGGGGGGGVRLRSSRAHRGEFAQIPIRHVGHVLDGVAMATFWGIRRGNSSAVACSCAGICAVRRLVARGTIVHALGAAQEFVQFVRRRGRRGTDGVVGAVAVGAVGT